MLTALQIALTVAVVAIVTAPAWWLAGRVLDRDARPFFRVLLAIGLGLVGYLTVVNLVGRQTGHSTVVASVYIAACLATGLMLRRRFPAGMSVMPLVATWREWAPVVLGAVILGVPQWFLAVSTPFWDEVAASTIHITAANQFAEGVFPPRHNALPDVVIKYHYGFTILSGTVHWLTGLSANVSIDVVSTCLWLFTFLFVVYWLRDLKVDRVPAFFGGVAELLGGGLAWLYLPRIEAFSGFSKVPDISQQIHTYRADSSVATNLLASMQAPSAYLRNGDFSLSNLPWDVAAQFQQHAVALGIALTLPALFLFVRWQTRTDARRVLAALVIATFSVLLLAHAVFGGVAAVTGGIVLLGVWLRAPTRRRFMDGVLFGVGVAIVGLAHGGFLARGAEYGSASDVFTWRGTLGYSQGGLPGFLHWNVAGFGVPLFLALVGWGAAVQHAARRARVPRSPGDMSPGGFALIVFTVFTVFAYALPQLAFYSSEHSGVEQLTEISKFFFAARLGFAMLSVFGVVALMRRVPWWTLAPVGAAMVVSPLLYAYVQSTKAQAGGEREWTGFYRSPYYRGSIEEQLAVAFRQAKHGPRDVYFDASADERRTGFLNELLLFGGSAFTVTPSAYERTGSGYRLAESVVARRFVQSSRMSRLLPGAAEDCDCRWYYARPEKDMVFAPMIARARFARMVADSVLVARKSGADRVLFAIAKPTLDVDRDIERYWRPRIVSQAHADLDGDGRDDLIFYDYVNHVVMSGRTSVAAPTADASEFSQLYVGRFAGDRKADFLFGRTGDTRFTLGRSIMDVVETSPWQWSYRSSESGTWTNEYERFFWNLDMPLIADINGDGADEHLVYRPRPGEWWAAPNTRVDGPTADAASIPLPFAGRFTRRSTGDLGLWSRSTTTFTIKTVGSGLRFQFRWGGNAGDILVPGDYAGLGFDQIAIWNPVNQFWYWRAVPDGAITQFQFGTPTSIPVPADYNHDGRVDPAYWEPRENKIYVTFSRGRRVDLVVNVPPHSIPAFVNWL